MTRSRSAVISFVVMFAVLVMAVQTVVPETGHAKGTHHRVEAEVVNGGDVPDAQFPFVAAIGYADPSGAFLWDNMFCGGSLVAPDLVLTAAHCVLGTTPPELAVVVGRTVLTSDQGQVRSVAEIIMDPSFNHAEATNDLALVRLTQPVTGIEPIRLIGAGDTTFNAPGTALTLLGWGDTLAAPHGGKPHDYPDRLQQAQVNVVDDDTCAKEWGRTGFHDDSVWAIILCTTPGVFGPGDSGSPLVVATSSGYVQVSLVSGSYAKHNKNKNENKKSKSEKAKNKNGKDNKSKKHNDSNNGKKSKGNTGTHKAKNKDGNKGGGNKSGGSKIKSEKNKKNKISKKKLHQQIPDYGPELSAASSRDFLAPYGV